MRAKNERTRGKNKKMKIAIEFYGHLRTFRETAPDILKHLVEVYDQPDIFIHTWNKSDHSDVTWHNMAGEKRGDALENDDVAFLEKTYHPKKILVEPQIVVPNDERFVMLMTENETPLSMIENVFYTKWRANELRKEYEKETGAQYDFVIQARLDLYFKKDFDIRDFIAYKTVLKKNPLNVDISKKFFYASDHWIEIHKTNDLLYAGGSDVMYFGLPDVIDKAVSVYPQIKAFDLKQDYYSNEYLLLKNVLNQGLEPVQIYFMKDRDFGVLRTKESLRTLAAMQVSAAVLPASDCAKAGRKQRLKALVFYYTSPFTQNILRRILRGAKAVARAGKALLRKGL